MPAVQTINVVLRFLLYSGAMGLILLSTTAHAQDYGGRSAETWEGHGSVRALKRVTVEVERGETLESLARRFRLDSREVRRWNKLTEKQQPNVGSEVVLYVGHRKIPLQHRKIVHVALPGETFDSIALDHNVNTGDLVSWNWRLEPDALESGTAVFIYQVPESIKRLHEKRKMIRDAQQLTDGPGYTVRNPERAWGTKNMVSMLQNAFAATHGRFPHAPALQVGDISKPHGGFIAPHVTHKTGRDVDIGYYIKGEPDVSKRLILATPETLDVEKTWYLVKEILESGVVKVILVDTALQKELYKEGKRTGLTNHQLRRYFHQIVHVPGHDDHFHVRVR